MSRLRTHDSRRFNWLSMLLCLFVLQPWIQAGVSAPTFRSRHWGREDGLPCNIVRAVTQTKDGYLWIAAQEELVRFDGTQFETVPFASAQGSDRQWLSDLCASRDGTLWIGSEDGLVWNMNGAKFKPYRYQGFETNLILKIYEDRQNTVWVGSRNGLWRLQEGKLCNVAFNGLLTATAVRSLDEDALGNLWVTYNDGVLCLTNGMLASVLTASDGLPSGAIRVVHRSRDGALWVCSTAGVARLKDGKVSRYSKRTGLPDNSVTTMYEDSRGNLWFGTFGGLARWTDGRFMVELTSEGDPYSAVNAIFEDHENSLWVGTKEGLYRLNPRQFDSWTTRQGLAHNTVISVLEDHAGSLWIATWGGGLQRYRNGQLTTFCMTNTPGLKTDLILSLYETRDGSIWAGTDYEGGAYRIKNDIFLQFSAKDGLPLKAVRCFFQDRSGRLWAGTSGGLFCFDEKRFNRVEHPALASAVIRCLIEDHEGQLWIGTESGLFCRRGERIDAFTKTNGLTSNLIAELYEDGEHSLWIGTGNGLNRLKEGKFLAWAAREGLGAGTILQILDDGKGQLWLGSMQGVCCVNKKDLEAVANGTRSSLRSVTFGKGDGMASSICVGTAKPSTWKSRDGRMWFTTTKGLAVTHPDVGPGENKVPPQMLLEKVCVDQKEIRIHTMETRIPPCRGELEFHYAALSYRAPEKNQYRYKLDGIDTDWVDAGSRRAAYYTKLPPGNYRFHVIGSNNDGVWNTAGVALNFTLEPHYWQTWWFQSCIAFGCLSLVAGSARYVTKQRMQRRLERVEQQHAVEKERVRIARDMHDDLGGGLTGVLLLTEKAQTSASKEDAVNISREIADSVRALAQGLDALVWAENPKHDTIARLVSYVTDYAVKFLGKASIACRLDIPLELPDSPASSEMRHHVYLVVREALNNVAKYSGAKEVWIRLKVEGVRLVWEIEDNGRGFSMGETRMFGNGLTNMRKRIEQIGGTFALDSAPGKGTRIQMQIPLKVDR